MAEEIKNSNKINETFASIFEGVSALATTKKVIGEPYTVGDTTIIPFIETSVGMGVGDFSATKQAGGVGCKVTPLACLVIQDGFTKLVSIKNQDVLTKAIDMIPDLVNKLTHKVEITEEMQDSIDRLPEEYEKNAKKKKN